MTVSLSLITTYKFFNTPQISTNILGVVIFHDVTTILKKHYLNTKVDEVLLIILIHINIIYLIYA